MQCDGFASKLGGIMEVAMWPCALLRVGLRSSLGLVTNYVVLVLRNGGGDPHHMQGRHHTWRLWFGLRKPVVLTLSIQQIFNRDLNRFLSFFLTYMFNRKSNYMTF